MTERTPEIAAASAQDIALSIIVPCYKVERYLPRCLDSLLAQTREDLEVICINDGSPDGCKRIIEDYARRYPGKVVLVDKRNEGVWRGRMDGIARARGRYIGFVDSDDYVEAAFAETLLTLAQRSDADIAVAGFLREDSQTGRVVSREMCLERPPLRLSEDPGRLLEVNTAPWNKAFRAGVLKNMHDLQSPPPVLDDVVFHLLAYLQACKGGGFGPAASDAPCGPGGRVAFSDRPIVHYLVRSDSMITSMKPGQVQAMRKAFLEVRDLYRADGASEAMFNMLDAMAFVHLGISALFRLSSTPEVRVSEEARDTAAFLDAEFPTWRDSPYFMRSYAGGRGATFRNMRIAHRVFKLGLMGPFLGAYSCFIRTFKRDIKW